MDGEKDLVSALERLERERNIKKEDVFKTIEDSLVSALRKHMGKSAQITANMDAETGAIKAYQQMKVVEIVVNPETEMTLEDAKKKVPKAKMNEEISIELDIAPFSRIAAQIAKQVLVQKVRDIERDNIYREYKPREGEVITGNISRYSDRDFMVDIGKTEAILPYAEQIRKERYTANSRVKAVILKVLTHLEILQTPEYGKYKTAISRMDKGQKGPYIILSRADGLFLKKLLEVEVPEIADRTIEVMSIERDAGFRAKVVVKTNDPKVDPVGACVGMRGMRIRSITNELSGERVDLINYTIDVEKMIANAMSPAKVSSVQITDKENKKALVVVPDDQLAVAIGRDWQNIKLASKITGWEIAAKSEKEIRETDEKARSADMSKLLEIDGIGPKTAEILFKAGVVDISKIAGSKPEDLATLQGVGEKMAERIIEGAKAYLSKNSSDSADTKGEVNDRQKQEAGENE